MNRPARVTQGEIAEPKWRHLHRQVDRHGKVRWYVRNGHGPRVAVNGDPGTKAFRESYLAIVSGQPLDDEAPNVQKPVKEKGPGFVYFLKFGATIKIGFSTSPLDRLQALKTGLPGPVGLFVAVPGTQRAEKTLHAQLAKFRISGEWFRDVPQVAKAIARYAHSGKVRLK